MRVLVCGGRDYADKEKVYAILDALKLEVHPDKLTIIQGGARGADDLARQWAFLQPSIHLINEPANWKLYGRSAGPTRNKLMLDQHKPDLVIAFPGGAGTADMVRKARYAGVTVREL